MLLRRATRGGVDRHTWLAHMAGRSLVVLIVLVLLATPALAKRRRGGSGSSSVNSVNSRKRECEQGDCAGAHEDDRPNCVLRCQSEACYEEVYMPEELEPGEIDLSRQRAFQTCLNNEVREAKRDRVKERRRPAAAASSAAAPAEDAEASEAPELEQEL